LGHNVALLTRPNCFGWYFFRLKRISEIGLAVFPEAKWFSTPIFWVKNEIQNSISEFATRYGMPVDRIGNGIGRQAARAAPPGPACGAAGPPAPARPAPPGLAPRPLAIPARPPARKAGRQAGRRKPGARQAAPAPVVNAPRQAPVAPAFEQKKARQAPRRASGQRERRGELTAAPGVWGRVYFMPAGLPAEW
jgi:hypothetical protein